MISPNIAAPNNPSCPNEIGFWMRSFINKALKVKIARAKPMTPMN